MRGEGLGGKGKEGMDGKESGRYQVDHPGTL